MLFQLHIPTPFNISGYIYKLSSVKCLERLVVFLDRKYCYFCSELLDTDSTLRVQNLTFKGNMLECLVCRDPLSP